MNGLARLSHLCVSLIVLFIAGPSDNVDIRPEYIQPPTPPDQPYPHLLTEHDVIRLFHVNGRTVHIGDGTYAIVTLGELRNGNEPRQLVAIKTFVDSSLDTIMREVRIHRFAENLEVTPRLIGLIPNGPWTNNVSLVYEYFHSSQTLSSWLKSKPSLSISEWLYVCIQMARILQKLHSSDILFNDLHLGNILIQKTKGRDVLVNIIDFGFSTHNHGKPYYSSYGSLAGYNYLAPELLNHLVTTQATDIFALGNLFFKIALYVRVIKLFSLSQWCMQHDPQNRPDLDSVVTTLKAIIFEVWLSCHIKGVSYLHIHTICKEIYLLDNADSDTKRTQHSSKTDRKSWETFGINKQQQYISEDITKDMIKDFNEDEYRGSPFRFSSKCPVKISFLDWRDVSQRRKVLSQSQHGVIRLSTLKLNNQKIILKSNSLVEFNDLRTEACHTGVLGKIGIAPNVIGILFGEGVISNVSLVQEYFGNGITLHEFIASTITYSQEYDDDIKLKYGHVSCTNIKFKDILNGLWVRRMMCIKPSNRQIVFEKIAEQLTSHLIKIHKFGFIVNNFNSHNIVVNGDLATKSVDVKLIDLGRITRINGEVFYQEFDYLSRFPYLAPEVKMGQESSFQSDTYSLCYLLHVMLRDYISANQRLRWIMHSKTRSSSTNHNDCYKRWYESMFNLPLTRNECHKTCRAPTATSNEHTHSINRSFSTFNDLKDKLNSYILLDELLFHCMHSPRTCRPSLYTLLKIFKRINYFPRQ